MVVPVPKMHVLQSIVGSSPAAMPPDLERFHNGERVGIVMLQHNRVAYRQPSHKPAISQYRYISATRS